MKEMDIFECLIQAYEYELQTYGEKDLNEFQGLSSKVHSPQGQEWLALLQGERRTHLSRQSRRLPVIFVISPPRIPVYTHDQDWLQCFSVEAALQEQLQDETFLHAEYLRQCLEKGLPVSTDLVVRSLEQQIVKRMERRKWSLLWGFPSPEKHYLEFGRKVSSLHLINLGSYSHR